MFISHVILTSIFIKIHCCIALYIYVYERVSVHMSKMEHMVNIHILSASQQMAMWS